MGKKFEIVEARTAGFCMGVRRAVRMALEAADRPRYPVPIRTHGPLIHNRQVLRVLEGRGVEQLDASDEGPIGTLVVRAHGLPVDEQEKARARGAELLDATCPHVRRAQELVRRYSAEGYLCVVLGDRGHAEVDGVLSYAGEKGRVVSGPDEVASLPDAERVVLVAQTTQDEELFRSTLERVRERYGDCLAFDTICRSTEQRQSEVRQLAPTVEAMIVVGGLNSANTRRLAEISAACGTPTYHVETDQQLDVEAMLAHERIGLTAGASTPSWMIRRVVRKLKDAHLRRTSPLAYAGTGVMRALVNSDVWAAGGAAMLTLANTRLMPVQAARLSLCMPLAFFFVLSQHLLNQYARRDSIYLNEPGKADFFMEHAGRLLGLGIASSALALLLAFLLGSWEPLALVVLGSLAGWLYRWRLPRGLGARIGVQSLEQVPGSRELFVALAWAVLGGIVPALAAGPIEEVWRGASVAFVVAFLMVFQRTLALNLRRVAADKIFGRETLAGALGRRGAVGVFTVFTALAFLVLLLLGGAAGWTTPFCYLMAVVALYGVCAALTVACRDHWTGERAELLVDAQFYLAGLAGAFWVAFGAAGGAGG